ncbi:MAG: hypothetical protein WCK41_06305 [Actinomycetes bacterium]
MTIPVAEPRPANASAKPSAAGYWIAAVIAVVGCVVATIWFAVTIAGMLNAADAYPRFLVPGSSEMHLDAKTYKLFVEYSGASLDSSQLPLVSGLVVSDATGNAVPISDPVIDENYAWGSREGRAIGEFTPGVAGTYVVAANTARENDPRAVTIAVGPGIDLASVGPLLGSMALGGLSALIALTLAIVTAIRRRQWKRRQKLVTASAASGGLYPSDSLPPSPPTFVAPSSPPPPTYVAPPRHPPGWETAPGVAARPESPDQT